MEIRFALSKNRALTITIGKEAPWYSSSSFIFVSIDYYDKKLGKVVYAKSIWHS